jgi:4-hydroxy-tetrahydrodipicolinate reductase
MGDLPGIVINGASGRMGRMLAQVVGESGRARLIGVLERPGHDWIGQDLGRAMGGPDMGVMVSDDPLDLVARAHAVIDFTVPAASVEMATLTAQARFR